jgi:hypothetical protein
MDGNSIGNSSKFASNPRIGKISDDPYLMVSYKIVTPVETGVQKIYNYLKELDSGFRRYDSPKSFQTFYEFILLEMKMNPLRNYNSYLYFFKFPCPFYTFNFLLAAPLQWGDAGGGLALHTLGGRSLRRVGILGLLRRWGS